MILLSFTNWVWGLVWYIVGNGRYMCFMLCWVSFIVDLVVAVLNSSCIKHTRTLLVWGRWGWQEM